MTTPHSEWTILPHGTLTAVDDSILTVTGTVKMPIGTFERRMTVVRLPDGDAIIYSPIALDDVQMRRLEAFGRPAFLVIPGSHHRVDAKIWKQRYPDAKMIAAEGARQALKRLYLSTLRRRTSATGPSLSLPCRERPWTKPR